MQAKQIDALGEAGWTVHSLDPLEIRHHRSAGVATGEAVAAVIRDAERDLAIFENQRELSELRELDFEQLVRGRSTAVVLALLNGGVPAAGDMLRTGYGEVFDWQVEKNIRKADFPPTQTDADIRTGTAQLADAFVRAGSAGVYDALFSLLSAAAQTR